MTRCANCAGEVPVDQPHKVGECTWPPTPKKPVDGATTVRVIPLNMSAVYLPSGETCLDCSSTALVGHWHTRTDCLVARTGWGGS
jgi:hypothetical protein